MELLRSFHPYLFKYLDMILRGHLPLYSGNRINEDAKKLLQYLLPKGAAPTKENLSKTCKHLHLAFKRYEAAEVYNILAACLLNFPASRGAAYGAALSRFS